VPEFRIVHQNQRSAVTRRDDGGDRSPRDVENRREPLVVGVVRGGGVDHDDVEPPEQAERLADQNSDAGPVAEVDRSGDHPTAGGDNPLRGVVQLDFQPACGERAPMRPRVHGDDVGTVDRETFAESAPALAGGSEHEHDLVVEPTHRTSYTI
jgi:hypothetical protein